MRLHYVAFNIKADTDNDAARYKLVLKKASGVAPSQSQVLSGAGVYRKITTTGKKVIIAYDINSGIASYKDAITGTVVTLHNAATNSPTMSSRNVDQYLLTPGAEYSIYAVEADGTNLSVDKVGSFSTDVFNEKNIPVPGTIPDANLMESFTSTAPLRVDREDSAMILPFSFNLTGMLALIFSYYNTSTSSSVTVLQSAQGTSAYTFAARSSEVNLGIMMPSQGTDSIKYYATTSTSTDFNLFYLVFKDLTYESYEISTIFSTITGAYSSKPHLASDE